MCLLQVHGQSHTSNACQAVAHNVDTTINDHTALVHLLRARGNVEAADRVEARRARLIELADEAWSDWEDYVTEYGAPNADDVGGAPIGSERIANHIAQHARIRRPVEVGVVDGWPAELLP